MVVVEAPVELALDDGAPAVCPLGLAWLVSGEVFCATAHTPQHMRATTVRIRLRIVGSLEVLDEVAYISRTTGAKGGWPP